MQAVILAAGEGKRMRPLTETRPKPLIEVGGAPLLAHVIHALPKDVSDVVIVIGYLGHLIQAFFGETFEGRRITYVTQEQPAGTAEALERARSHLTDRFFVLCGDDLHGRASFEKALQHPLAILAARHPEPSKFGVIETGADGTLRSFTEKPDQPASDLVSTGAMLLDMRIFMYPSSPAPNGERYLTTQVEALAQEAPITIVIQDAWLPVGYPEDLPKAEAFLED